MILLTTSRRPTRRIRTFCHDLSRSVPNSFIVNRGKMGLQELAQNAVERGLDGVIIIERWKGGPGRISLYKIGQRKLVQVPPQIYIGGIKLQREFKERETTVNSLMIGRQSDEPPSEIIRLSVALSDFLNIPFMSIDKVGSGFEAAVKVCHDDALLPYLSFFLLPKIVEIGPRITISHLVWEFR